MSLENECRRLIGAAVESSLSPHGVIFPRAAAHTRAAVFRNRETPVAKTIAILRNQHRALFSRRALRRRLLTVHLTFLVFIIIYARALCRIPIISVFCENAHRAVRFFSLFFPFWRTQIVTRVYFRPAIITRFIRLLRVYRGF